MANGKPGDNPLTDLVIYGEHPFSHEIEELLVRIHQVGREQGRWPLGEHWPFSTREFEWEQGRDLEGARRDLTHLLDMMEAGRGDEVLLDPITKRPLSEG